MSSEDASHERACRALAGVSCVANVLLTTTNRVVSGRNRDSTACNSAPSILATKCGRGPSIIGANAVQRSEEHTSEFQSLMRISYAVFCLKNKNNHYK